MIDPKLRALALRHDALTQFENGDECVNQMFLAGMRAGHEGLDQQVKGAVNRALRDERAVADSEERWANEYFEKWQAEHARSKKLLLALREISKRDQTERQIQNLNPFIASDAEIARHALDEHEASRD